MAAAVHYNGVAQATWPELQRAPLSNNKLNNPWDVRQNVGDVELPNGRFLRIDIDAETFAIINNSNALYVRLKDLEWFVKDGAAYLIVHYDPKEKKFEYRSMHGIIYGGPCEHDNGDRLDNRRNNLVPLGEARAGHPACLLKDLRRSCPNSRHLEKIFLKRLAAFEEWYRKVEALEDVEWECPPDPRLDERFRSVLINLKVSAWGTASGRVRRIPAMCARACAISL